MIWLQRRPTSNVSPPAPSTAAAQKERAMCCASARSCLFFQTCSNLCFPPGPLQDLSKKVDLQSKKVGMKKLALHQPQAPDRSGQSWTSTASARSQWAVLDINHKRQIAVGSLGHQPQAPDRIWQSWTSTASARSQWAVLDINRKRQIAVGSLGHQPQAPDRSGQSWASTASARSQWAVLDIKRKR